MNDCNKRGDYMKHIGAPLWLIKQELALEYINWCKDVRCNAELPENMIEFLIQKVFIQGKQWLEWIDNMNRPGMIEMLEKSGLQPLREGFIPPKSIIGYREK